MTYFTVEEENFMFVFNTVSRSTLIDGIIGAMPDFYEPELLEIAQNTLRKLEGITDAEFETLEFYPAFEDDDETEV